MSNAYNLILVAVSALITFSLRALPFLAFSHERKMPSSLETLGKILPSAIMAVLVVYCLKDVFVDFSTYGIPELLAAAVVVISYKWKHNTLVSILLGTATNMILCAFL